jgi:hypothetical protein
MRPCEGPREIGKPGFPSRLAPLLRLEVEGVEAEDVYLQQAALLPLFVLCLEFISLSNQILSGIAVLKF